MNRTISTAAFCLLLCAATPVSAADETRTPSPDAQVPTDVRYQLPVVAYAYRAGGASAGTMGVQALGVGLVGSDGHGVVGGGGSIWGSPLDRLTLVADAQRDVSRNFSPAAAAIFRIAGSSERGLSFGALGRFKIDGFAAGPDRDEIESEVELGALASLVESGWLVDLNAIGGRGVGDDGETDAEGRLRLGRDVTDWLRIGLDGQARLRLSGPRYLPSGRTWDFASGLQGLARRKNFFLSMTAGPATAGMTTSSVGWVFMTSVGGVEL